MKVYGILSLAKSLKPILYFLNTRREELESQLEQARDKIDQLMADGEHEKARVQELESVINKTEKKVIILISDNSSI